MFNCPHCNSTVCKTEHPDYFAQCLSCDEDFYYFELNKAVYSISAKAQETAKCIVASGELSVGFSENTELENYVRECLDSPFDLDKTEKKLAETVIGTASNIKYCESILIAVLYHMAYDSVIL